MPIQSSDNFGIESIETHIQSSDTFRRESMEIKNKRLDTFEVEYIKTGQPRARILSRGSQWRKAHKELGYFQGKIGGGTQKKIA
jgi:hypothetical protein